MFDPFTTSRRYRGKIVYAVLLGRGGRGAVNRNKQRRAMIVFGNYLYFVF